MHPQPAAGRNAPGWTYLAALALVASNIVPLAGVLYFGWNLFTVMLLFWLDNVVIGFYAIPRVWLARLYRQMVTGVVPPKLRAKNARMFAFVYFFFTLIHGLFLILIFSSFELRRPENAGKGLPEYLSGVLLQPELAAGVLALVASRGFDFYFDYLRPKAYETADFGEQGGAAFGRVILLHVVILAGGFLIVWLGSPTAALALLVVLKTAGDLVAHYYSNRPRNRGS